MEERSSTKMNGTNSCFIVEHFHVSFIHSQPQKISNFVSIDIMIIDTFCKMFEIRNYSCNSLCKITPNQLINKTKDEKCSFEKRNGIENMSFVHCYFLLVTLTLVLL